MHLIAFLQPAQDGDGVLDAGLIDHDRLEPAFERGVLLDVFAILVEGGGADGAELTPGELGLEQVARVHRTLGGSRAHDGVELVDEEDDLAFAAGDLLEEGLEAFLEVAAEFCPGDHRADVHGDDALVLEGLGDVSADDATGQAFDDRRFTDAGLADEDGIVLRTAREDLHHAADLFVTTDDRVDLAFAGKLGEVAPVFLKRLVFAFGVLVGHTLRAPRTSTRACINLSRVMPACLSSFAASSFVSSRAMK